MTEDLIDTRFRVFIPGIKMTAAAEKSVLWPKNPGYVRLKALIEPLLNGAHMEHVSVLHNGKRADMFVDEEGLLKGLERNEEATKIYRNNWLAKHPGFPPEDMSAICGVAILFDRIVWS